MKRLLSLHLIVFGLVAITQPWASAAPVPPTVSAISAILIDATTGKVLYEKRCHLRRPPASTTKMMTAILAIEQGKLNSTVCASPYACQTQFGSLHLKNGERLTLRELLYGTILRSANDGAVCIAENVAGTESKFVDMMNEKAKKIGANDTHFVNPHGLYVRDHYSTAYDLAMIARYATGLPEFNKIVGTKTRHIERSINQKDVFIRNTAARFLCKYGGADGIKTGYTKEAGHCFVGSATRKGWKLISVVMKSNNSGKDTGAIMNYGFKYYKQVCIHKANQKATTVRVAGGDDEKIDLVCADNLATIVDKSVDVRTSTDIKTDEASAPINKGTKLGTLTGYLNGHKVGTVDLVAARSVNRALAATIYRIVRGILSLCAVFIVGYIAYGTAIAQGSRRRRRSISQRS